MVKFPFETSALRVQQPLGSFYVAVIPAEVLLQVAASDVMSAALNPSGVGYTLAGTQRALQDKRISQIAAYLDRADAAFPNSIILAANHNRELGVDEDEAEDIDAEVAPPGSQTSNADREWTIVETENGDYRLRIPTAEKLAAIIDGQHRLFAFTGVKTLERAAEMQLICAVFLDLPKPLQAQLFATINSTQKPVDRSLTYELFGYNVAEEPEDFWTPDKLAVFLTRKLGTDPSSPLRGRITVAPKKDRLLADLTEGAQWKVSTAVVVDGIQRLITGNPKRDTNIMLSPSAKRRSSLIGEAKRDTAPLRDAFIAGQDAIIYKLVENYLGACSDVLWQPAKPGSFILKTVGLQAQFDVLRVLAGPAYAAKDVRKEYFVGKLAQAGQIDFSTDRFKNASGSGRTLIRRAIEEALQTG